MNSPHPKHCALLLLALLSTACPTPNGDTKVEDTSDDTPIDTSETPITTEAWLVLGTPSDATMNVVVPVTAVHPKSAPVVVTFEFSADGAAFQEATILGAPITLQSSPDPGTNSDVTWDSISDIGPIDATVVIRASVPGEEKTWTGDETDPFQVTNAAINLAPTLAVTTPAPTLRSGGVDGDIVIPFELEDLNGDPCDVTLTWSDGSGSYTATATSGSDNLNNITTGSYEFIWNAMEDLGPVDVTDVTVSLVAFDGELYSDEVTSGAFDVELSPIPDEGEIFITEIMRWPAYSVNYIELYNSTLHPLDLNGTFLVNVDGDQVEIGNAANPGFLPLLASGDYATITTDESVFNSLGIPYFYAVDSIFARVEDSIILSDGVSELTRVDYESQTWPYEMGKSMQLDPEIVDYDDLNVAENWCSSSDLMLAGGDWGTPGEVNTACSGSPVATCDAEEAPEPNESKAVDLTTFIAAGNTFLTCGNISLCANDGKSWTGDIDVFGFEVITAATLTITLSWDPTASDLDYYVVTKDGTDAPIVGANAGGSPEQASGRLTPGIYYLVVAGWEGAAADYELETAFN